MKESISSTSVKPSVKEYVIYDEYNKNLIDTNINISETVTTNDKHNDESI